MSATAIAVAAINKADLYLMLTFVVGMACLIASRCIPNTPARQKDRGILAIAGLAFAVILATAPLWRK